MFVEVLFSTHGLKLTHMLSLMIILWFNPYYRDIFGIFLDLVNLDTFNTTRYFNDKMGGTYSFTFHNISDTAFFFVRYKRE